MRKTLNKITILSNEIALVALSVVSILFMLIGIITVGNIFLESSKTAYQGDRFYQEEKAFVYQMLSESNGRPIPISVRKILDKPIPDTEIWYVAFDKNTGEPYTYREVVKGE
ncbi:hypothetical protein JXA27_06795 [Aerococcaceae bacterium zg-B36]|uniref:hypothetical protein n=1 Tax=Aerococcaceae bacterium zg-252 TaxID=2796928 RepID=UPI001BD8BAC0|nr:hypothetical protein [Aerococcaceae bacterium zg-B36]